MKKTILLTESDLKNIILEAILEYTTQNSAEEGKTANILAALGLAAGTVAGINKTQADREYYDRIQPPQAMYTVDNTNRTDNTNTVNYADYMKQNYLKRFQQNKNNITTNDSTDDVSQEYYPSDKLIDFIKSYESFHDGWIDDGDGNLTTGWGFKITPELKKRFPTGMHRDKHGNTPEADAYLKEFINNNLKVFKKYTPNLDKLPQEYGDALFDVFYNVGSNTYKNSPKLQKALNDLDLVQIANNLKYGKLRGHKLRSMDRKNILKGIYQRS